MVQDDDRSAASDALRHALYRPGASSADLARYESRFAAAELVAASDAATGSPEEPPTTASRKRRLQVAIGGAAVAGVLIVLGLVGAHRPDAPAPEDGARATARPMARDSGPMTYAQGAVEPVEAGQYRYAVAPGDTELGIAARFHVCIADVEAGLPPGTDNGALPVGTVIAIALSRWEVRADGAVGCG